MGQYSGAYLKLHSSPDIRHDISAVYTIYHTYGVHGTAGPAKLARLIIAKLGVIYSWLLF